jgi:RimJ/RimL family protein N-acetyltransferase
VELRDGDLLLRRYAAGDAEALVAVLNDEEIARFIPLVPQPCGWWRGRPVRLVTHPDNVASQRVAEKAGFRLVGTELHEQAFRDGSAEVVVFRLD